MGKIKLIIHMADIHIRPYQRLEEYKVKLNELDEKLSGIVKPYEHDEVRIVVSGDITHNKLNISNELISFVATWIRSLEKHGKVVVISGNHDLVVGNTSRVDTLTAVFTAAQFANATHFDSYLGYDSGIVPDENITWALYSIFTDYRRPDIEKARKDFPDNIVIGLYHGPIVGSALNNGTLIENGTDAGIFEGCDIVMAGDIHKRQEIKYGETKIVYPGSLVQQNFGESVTQHGFVVWNMENNTHEYVDLSDDYSMYDFSISSAEDIDNDKETLINK